MASKRITKRQKQFLEVFESKGCNISEGCKAIGISRQAYYKWMKENENFNNAVEDCNESFIDRAQSRLIQEVDKGNMKAIALVLTTKGKSRGYSPTLDVNNKGTIFTTPSKEEYDEAAKEMEEHFGGG